MRNVSEPQIVLVGVTGGIGSGKSTVCNLFEQQGRHVISADLVAREIVEQDEAVRAELRKSFGDVVFRKDGVLDRIELSAIVFSDQKQKRKLDEIVHPRVFEEIDRRVDLLSPTLQSPYVLIEAALIYETAMDEWLSYVIVVNASVESRIHRVMTRDGCSKEEVINRMNSQMEMEKKVQLADFVLKNEGTVEELAPKVKFLDTLLCMMGKGVAE